MTNQQGAPEALRLAEEFEKDGWIAGTKQWCAEVSAELRRLHAENERLAALVKAQQPAPSVAVASKAVLAAIRAANMQLVRTGDDAFMLVPHKVAAPQADNAPTSVEDAENKQAGFAHSDWSFKAEVLDTSPPSAGEKFLEEPDVQDESGLNKYYSRELVLICIEEALASKAAPQADSQPVMTPETVYAAIAHGDEEHRAWLLSALRAVWCGEAVPPVASPIADAAAESQPEPVLDERDDFEKVLPLPSGCVRVGTGYASTGYSNWAAHTHCERWQGWQARAARAPADSVTAPAGGANWQDISTAPKDGTRFVAVGNNYGLYSEAQHTCIAQWFRDCWIEASDWNEISELKYLTHWMPLLPLPGSAEMRTQQTIEQQEIAPLTDEELCQIEEPHLVNFRIPLGGQYDFARDVEKAVLAKTRGMQATTPPPQAADSVTAPAGGVVRPSKHKETE